jgi:predicted RND superfamily exporter protein
MREASDIGFFGKLALWVMHHRAITIAVLGVVTAIAVFFMARLKVDSDILKLMPADDPTTIALAKLDEEEGGINILTLAFQCEDLSVRDAFMDELVARLEALDSIDYVLYKLDPQTALRLGILQVPKDDLVVLRDRLNAALSMGPAAANPFIAGRLFDFGPLTEKLANSGGGLALSDKDLARIVIRPTGSAHDIPFARTFMADVENILKELDPQAKGIALLWKGGAYRHNVEDYEGIVQDIKWTTATSFVLVLIIIGAAFRAPRAIGLIFIPLILSNIWTAGLAGATVGSLNTFTSFVNAILIGLGVEFGVHLYSRFREERTSGLGTEEAVIKAWDLVGGACTSAAFTSAAGFAALFAAHFAGFQQLGWLLSCGLILTLIAELVCMPMLLTVMEPRATHFHAVRHAQRKKRKLPMLYRLAPMVLLVITSITLVSAILVRKIGFEYDLSELRREGLAYEDLSERERKLARDSFAPILVEFPDAATLEAEHLRLSQKIEAGRFPEISRVVSILTVLPADQEERVALVQEIIAASHDPNAIYFPAKVKENIKKLEDAQIHVMRAEELPLPLQHVFGANGGKHRLLLIPAGNMWDMREAATMANAVKRELPGRNPAGEYMTLGLLYQLLRQDSPIIAAIAAFLVCLFTWMDLRSVRSTLGAILVQVAGLAWWGALLVLSDIKISIVNFVGIPIVMGIGIDVMIHMIHRLNQEGPGKITKVLETTGWASALGTSTTVVAFAALSLGTSQGIRSLGLLVLLGEMAVTVAGFALIPLGFATIWHLSRQKHHESSPESEPGNT